MSDETIQPGAMRAWYAQLWNCGLVVVLLAAVPLALRYELGPMYPINGFLRWWMLNSILIIAYMAERTRYDWVQLRYMRRLGRELTSSEFQVRRANERLHRKALVVGLVFGFLLLMLHRAQSAALEIIALVLLLGIGAKSALSAWGDLRRLNRINLSHAPQRHPATLD